MRSTYVRHFCVYQTLEMDTFMKYVLTLKNIHTFLLTKFNLFSYLTSPLTPKVTGWKPHHFLKYKSFVKRLYQ